MGKVGCDPRRRLDDDFAWPEVPEVDAQANGMTFDMGPGQLLDAATACLNCPSVHVLCRAGFMLAE